MDSNEIDLLEQLLTKGFDSNYRFDIIKLIKHFSEKNDDYQSDFEFTTYPHNESIELSFDGFPFTLDAKFRAYKNNTSNMAQYIFTLRSPLLFGDYQCVMTTSSLNDGDIDVSISDTKERVKIDQDLLSVKTACYQAKISLLQMVNELKNSHLSLISMSQALDTMDFAVREYRKRQSEAIQDLKFDFLSQYRFCFASEEEALNEVERIKNSRSSTLPTYRIIDGNFKKKNGLKIDYNARTGNFTLHYLTEKLEESEKPASIISSEEEVAHELMSAYTA